MALALKTGVISKPATGDVTFGGVKFSTGAKSNQTLIDHLTTQSLKGAGGSSPGSGACSIVGELGSDYDLRDRVDIKQVKKALGKPAVINKGQKARKPGPVLELLGLDGLLLLSDYNWFNAGRFVRGHLWPESLGGPGLDWNLTPMGAMQITSGIQILRSLSAKILRQQRKSRRGSDIEWWLSTRCASPVPCSRGFRRQLRPLSVCCRNCLRR